VEQARIRGSLERLVRLDGFSSASDPQMSLRITNRRLESRALLVWMSQKSPYEVIESQ
jgi:hypothetical protein